MNDIAANNEAIIDEQEAPELGKLYIDKAFEEPVSNNKLKADGKAVTVIMPDMVDASPDPLIEFDINEKPIEEELMVDEPILTTDEPLVEDMPLSVNEVYAQKVAAGLELEIKPTIDEEEEDIPLDVTVLPTNETADEPIVENIDDDEDEDDIEVDETALELRSDELATINYDPTLDLRDYQYPDIALLETHGSEKIVHDPAELEMNKNQIIATLKITILLYNVLQLLLVQQ